MAYRTVHKGRAMVSPLDMRASCKRGRKGVHETIYTMIRNDESGELRKHCRHKMKYRRSPLRCHITKATNFTLMEKLKHGKKAKPLAKTVWRLLLPYKGEILKTITTDNGSEFAEHEWITKHLNVPIYFTYSYCSWQKGGVENENKLIRQYIPKGTDITNVTDSKIKKTQHKLNARP